MISVIVPTFNEEEGVEACLKSLCDQTLPRDQYEIIVVDGNSKDKTREIAEKYADKVFIQTSKKVGGARNDGAMAAKYDILATTDADCFLPRDWLEKILADFAKYPDASTIYGIVYPLEPGIKHKLSLLGYNIVSRIGYWTGTIYMTLGCARLQHRVPYRLLDGNDLYDAWMQHGVSEGSFRGGRDVHYSGCWG